MCHYIILHIFLHILLRSLFFLKRMQSSTFFIPISQVCYICGKNRGIATGKVKEVEEGDGSEGS